MRPTTALTLVALVVVPILARPSPYSSGGSTTLSGRTNNEISRRCFGPGCDAPTTVRRSADAQNPVQAPEPEPGASSDSDSKSAPAPPTPPAPTPSSPSSPPSATDPSSALKSEPSSGAGASSPSSQDPVGLPATHTSPTKPAGQNKTLANKTGGGKASKLEVTMVQWVRDRLFEVFFGLHLGKVRSLRAITDVLDIDSVAHTGAHK